MNRKAVSGIMLALFLIGMLTLTFNIPLVKAEPTTIIVPDDYEKIQWAIGNASDGDTIFVRSGTYYENVVVDKTLSLFGESTDNTIIDGGGSGIVVQMKANDTVIKGFTIQNADTGIQILGNLAKHNIVNGNIISNTETGILVVPVHLGISNITIVNNTVSNNVRGIVLYGGSPNIISGNLVTNNEEGMIIGGLGDNTILGNKISDNFFGMILRSSKNSLKDNGMINNHCNLVVWSTYNDIDTSNTVNGKPIYYLVNQRDLFIDPSTFPNIGYLGLINCANVTVKNLTLTHNGQGILVAYSTNITIIGNTITDNLFGVSATGGLNAIISNTISDNLLGIDLRDDANAIIGNIITNNTFRNLPVEVFNAYRLYYWWVRLESIYHISGGIYILGSDNNIITGNTIADNENGLYLEISSGNTLRNNNIMGNQYNFGVEGWELSNHIQDIDASNLVNGKPICYWVNENGKQVPANTGYVALINSTNIIVKDLNLTNNAQGIKLAATNNTIISGNTITNTKYGIFTLSPREIVGWQVIFHPCINNTIGDNKLTNNGVGILLRGENNTVSSNTLSNNLLGIKVWSWSNVITRNTIVNHTYPPWQPDEMPVWWLWWPHPDVMSYDLDYYWALAGVALEGPNNLVVENTIAYNDVGMYVGMYARKGYNLIYHNNFVNNTEQLGVASINMWDNGYPLGGNYWSDYTGEDLHSGPGQDELGSDGIGDSPYFVGKWVDPMRARDPEAINQYDRYPLMNPWAPPPPTKIAAAVSIHPRALNLRGRSKWITAHIGLPEGYNVSDIDISTIRLNDTISVDPNAPVHASDHDSDGVVDLMVKFNRTELTSHVYYTLGIKNGKVTLTVTGIVAGTPFEGSDSIRVILQSTESKGSDSSKVTSQRLPKGGGHRR